MNRKSVGDVGEEIARNFLKKKGYRIREKNFHCREGEIDLVAEIKNSLVFIEVRTKTTGEFGGPEESVTATKKDKLVKSALKYLVTHKNLPQTWRIDFIGIELDDNYRANRVNHIENAITDR